MNVIFMGTPQFAIPAIEAINNSHHNLCCVVCQPDRLGNRNKLISCAVKQWATENDVVVHQFDKASLTENIDLMSQYNPDIIITAAYGQMLSQKLIDMPKHGIINIHGSLLPKLRGASPIQSSIINGDNTTGITILNTVKRMDAGEIIAQQSIDILCDETFGELYERMAVLGGNMIVSVLDDIASGNAVYTEQNEEQATYCSKILAQHETINWNNSSKDIVNLVRGLNPQPRANTVISGKNVKIISATINDTIGEKCGTVAMVTKKSLVISSGTGSVNILKLQPAGGKPMDIASFLCGNKLAVGDKVGSDE